MNTCAGIIAVMSVANAYLRAENERLHALVHILTEALEEREQEREFPYIVERRDHHVRICHEYDVHNPIIEMSANFRITVHRIKCDNTNYVLDHLGYIADTMKNVLRVTPLPGYAYEIRVNDPSRWATDMNILRVYHGRNMRIHSGANPLYYVHASENLRNTRMSVKLALYFIKCLFPHCSRGVMVINELPAFFAKTEYPYRCHSVHAEI
jgi:hypothetical protein